MVLDVVSCFLSMVGDGAGGETNEDGGGRVLLETSRMNDIRRSNRGNGVNPADLSLIAGLGSGI